MRGGAERAQQLARRLDVGAHFHLGEARIAHLDGGHDAAVMAGIGVEVAPFHARQDVARQHPHEGAEAEPQVVGEVGEGARASRGVERTVEGAVVREHADGVVLAGGRLDHERLAAEIVRHALSRLAYYKAPGYVAFVSALPLTSTEKIQRGALKQDVARIMAGGEAIDTRAMKKRSV